MKKLVILLPALLLAIGIMGISGYRSFTRTAPDQDTIAPRVTSTSSANNTSGIAIDKLTTAAFSEAMNASTRNASTFTANEVPGPISYSSGVATFTPASNLEYETRYTATTTTGTKDSAGNAISTNYSWSFKAEGEPDTIAPLVSATTPLDNETDVPVDSSITATFSEEMNSSTIKTATFTVNGISGTVSYSGRTATFTPMSYLAPNTTYSAAITGGVEDLAGNGMAQSYSWSFTTEPIRVTFSVFLDTSTPEGEEICVFIDSDKTIYPMTQISAEEHETTITHPDFNIGYGITYRYCRNCMYAGADESSGENNEMMQRGVTIDAPRFHVSDTVEHWRWWPKDGIIPPIDTSEYQLDYPNYLPRNNFQTGIQLPDYWLTIWNSCRLIEDTLDDIVKNTGAAWVQYSPVPEITQFYPEPIIVREGNNGTPESQLIRIITEAHKRGLKFFLNPGPWALDVSDPSPNDHEISWWQAWETQWRPIILYYAQIASEHDVEMLGFMPYSSYFTFPTGEEVPFVDAYARSLISDIREIYDGDICVFYMLPPWDNNMAYYGDGDYLGYALFPRTYELTDSENPAIDEMLTQLQLSLDGSLKEGASKYNKPIIMTQIAASSYDGAAINDPDWQTQLYFEEDDPNVLLDLQEQADIYETYLRALTERDWIQGAYSFNYNYWDSLDKAPSIRAKPAESVLAKWFKWISPDNRRVTITASEGGSTDPSPASYLKTNGVNVTIEAIPNNRYIFSHWTGDVPPGNENSNPLILTINSNISINAVFVPRGYTFRSRNHHRSWLRALRPPMNSP